jgi:hypothetical protein
MDDPLQEREKPPHHEVGEPNSLLAVEDRQHDLVDRRESAGSDVVADHALDGGEVGAGVNLTDRPEDAHLPASPSSTWC